MFYKNFFQILSKIVCWDIPKIFSQVLLLVFILSELAPTTNYSNNLRISRKISTVIHTWFFILFICESIKIVVIISWEALLGILFLLLNGVPGYSWTVEHQRIKAHCWMNHYAYSTCSSLQRHTYRLDRNSSVMQKWEDFDVFFED